MKKSSPGQKIGKYVKYQREKRNLTLREFAHKADLTSSYIFRLEDGTYQGVTLNVIEKLAHGFDIPVKEFLKKCGITEEPTTSTLPQFSFYLREKYQLPTEAVEDMNLFLSFVQKKYKEEIETLQKKHEEYWKEN